ncbi:protease [Southern Psittacara leucophthalmus aviadenovirus]|uniref:Protease n=1 Tax=Southern Psittacara leucophthalmus aviadenovirus TaxID=2604330 RepID=A0AAE6M7M9_9ADEN|nr:protease [Southern Psittacara leucophthalmus aviadenovirus]QEJ80775.1 protease [Southern Psittacara leucophthalmus aviadenovirus]
MSGTTETELRALVGAMQLHHQFLGVFDNTFPGFLNPARPASAIVNTGSRRSGGMHWIAFAFDPASKKCYMFDPFGWSDRSLWDIYRVKYDSLMRRTGLSQPDKCFKLVRSVECVQCPCSAACGLFSALFIAAFDRYRYKPMLGNPIIDVVVGVDHANMYKPAFQEVLHRNQERMYHWFQTHNPYFAANSQRLREETRINAMPENHVN